MKFITIKNTKKKILYSVKVEGETVVVYVFDEATDKLKLIRAIHINRNWLLKKLVNGK